MDIQDVTKQHLQLLKIHRDKLSDAHRRKGEKLRQSKSKQAMVDEFMLKVLVQQMEMTTFHYQQSFVPPAYAPCLRNFDDLKAIAINDMRLETHHRGTSIILRSLTPPWKLTALMTIMEDMKGTPISLNLYQQEDREVRAPESIIRAGTIVVVKEPYCKLMGDGTHGIRVDHPSDILFLQDYDPRIPKAWAAKPTQLKGSADAWKLDGNKSMEKSQYWAAIESYCQALELADAAETEIIKRNRALAYLRTGQFDRALEDVGYPQYDEETSPKAILRAAEALYGLRRFQEALLLLEHFCRIYPDDDHAKKHLKRTQERLTEHGTGNYNFGRLHLEARKLHSLKLDHASFHGSTDIRQAASHGRGLFVTESLKAGDVIMVEKAFAFAHSDKKNLKITLLVYPETNRATLGTHADLIGMIVRNIHRNPSIASEFLKLYKGTYQADAPCIADDQPVVDTFLVSKIIELNVFGSPKSSLELHKKFLAGEDMKSLGREASGIWIRASYINHSCTSTAVRSFIGDMMIIRAARDLQAGEEITFGYQAPHMGPVFESLEKLQHWGFACDCAICDESRSVSVRVQRQRKKFGEQLAVLLKAKPINTGRIMGVAQIMEATYARPANEVPRISLWHPYYAASAAYQKQNSPPKSVEYAIKTLTSALGFVVSGIYTSAATSTAVAVAKLDNFEIVHWGLATDGTVALLLRMAESFTFLRKPLSAAKCLQYARVAYKIEVGEDDTFLKTYGF